MNQDKKCSFKIKVRTEFAAAHHIRGYEGDCARPHGHNYKVEVEVGYMKLNSIGLAIDFKDLKKTLQSITGKFDHQDINTIAPFTDINPTAETLAQYFFKELELKIPYLLNVTVWENDDFAASYGNL